MNSISFQGKKEILHGLSKAAECAKAAEYCRAASFGPRPCDRSVLEMTNKTSMGNFLDMVCYDKGFIDTMKNLKIDEIKDIANMLRPEKVQYGEINPLKIFKDVLLRMCKAYKKNEAKPAINQLLNEIK